ncbi:lysozyme inhibitor LprI family protein [Enterobacter sp. KBR-315C3_2022]|uniref:lysozyme inhibitor LprI family protein n=1 Tax=Enterobacter sp. KBR-315C3_2022 TaxID=3242494 RepID=UPI0035285DC4
MIRRILSSLFFLTLFFCGSAMAVNCQRAVSPLENTICNNDNLHWLDSTLSVIYNQAILRENVEHIDKKYYEWEKLLEKCTSDACIERAYYAGISAISDTNRDFKWEGKWWNMLSPNMSGGVIQFSRNAQWSVTLDIRAWAGLNHDEFTAEARRLYGMLVVEKVVDTSNCKVLLIPRKDNSLQVYSNSDWGCRLSMPTGVFLDGAYKLSDTDPRPKATLLTLGIFPDGELDAKFRGLVGADYQNFVDSANVYIYQNDIDNIGARVLSMWVQGAANSRTAIIMYTPKGEIWAGRISPVKGGGLELHYYSTDGNDQRKMPRTLAAWKLRFLED